MFNSGDRRESEGEKVTEEGAGGVETGGADAAASSPKAAAGATGGKGKKKGKRYRQGHKANTCRNAEVVKTSRLT